MAGHGRRDQTHVAVATLALALTGCAASGAMVRPEPPRVEAMTLTFAPDGRGELSATLHVSSELPVQRVDWSLALDGVRLASGMTGVPPREGERVYLQVPLWVVHRVWQPGPAFAQLELTGALMRTADDAAEQVPFVGRFEQRLDGHFESSRAER